MEKTSGRTAGLGFRAAQRCPADRRLLGTASNINPVKMSFHAFDHRLGFRRFAGEHSPTSRSRTKTVPSPIPWIGSEFPVKPFRSSARAPCILQIDGRGKVAICNADKRSPRADSPTRILLIRGHPGGIALRDAISADGIRAATPRSLAWCSRRSAHGPEFGVGGRETRALKSDIVRLPI